MSPQRRTALVSVVAAAALIALKLAVGLAHATASGCSPRRCTPAPTSSPRCSPSSPSATRCARPIGATTTATARPSTCPRSRRRRSSSLATVVIVVAARSRGSPARVRTQVRPDLVRARRRRRRDRDRHLARGRLLARGAAVLERGAAVERAPLRERSRRLGRRPRRARRSRAPATRTPTRSRRSFVAVIVLLAATRLMRRNVDVLMDRAPADATRPRGARSSATCPGVSLRRLRLRQAAGRHLRRRRDRRPARRGGRRRATPRPTPSRTPSRRALPEADVVVHVEPEAGTEAALRERVQAAALSVPRVREIHNVNVIDVDGRTEISLHLKLPGALSLDEAHAVAEQVEQAILATSPEVASVADAPRAAGGGRRRPSARCRRRSSSEAASCCASCVSETGGAPRELRFLETDDGLVVFLTLGARPAHRAGRRARDGERDRGADPAASGPRSPRCTSTRSLSR